MDDKNYKDLIELFDNPELILDIQSDVQKLSGILVTIRLITDAERCALLARCPIPSENKQKISHYWNDIAQLLMTNKIIAERLADYATSDQASRFQRRSVAQLMKVTNGSQQPKNFTRACLYDRFAAQVLAYRQIHDVQVGEKFHQDYANFIHYASGSKNEKTQMYGYILLFIAVAFLVAGLLMMPYMAMPAFATLATSKIIAPAICLVASAIATASGLYKLFDGRSQCISGAMIDVERSHHIELINQFRPI